MVIMNPLKKTVIPHINFHRKNIVFIYSPSPTQERNFFFRSDEMKSHQMQGLKIDRTLVHVLHFTAYFSFS